MSKITAVHARQVLPRAWPPPCHTRMTHAVCARRPTADLRLARQPDRRVRHDYDRRSLPRGRSDTSNKENRMGWPHAGLTNMGPTHGCISKHHHFSEPFKHRSPPDRPPRPGAAAPPGAAVQARPPAPRRSCLLRPARRRPSLGRRDCKLRPFAQVVGTVSRTWVG